MARALSRHDTNNRHAQGGMCRPSCAQTFWHSHEGWSDSATISLAYQHALFCVECRSLRFSQFDLLLRQMAVHGLVDGSMSDERLVQRYVYDVQQPKADSAERHMLA